MSGRLCYLVFLIVLALPSLTFDILVMILMRGIILLAKVEFF